MHHNRIKYNKLTLYFCLPILQFIVLYTVFSPVICLDSTVFFSHALILFIFHFFPTSYTIPFLILMAFSTIIQFFLLIIELLHSCIPVSLYSVFLLSSSFYIPSFPSVSIIRVSWFSCSSWSLIFDLLKFFSFSCFRWI